MDLLQPLGGEQHVTAAIAGPLWLTCPACFRHVSARAARERQHVNEQIDDRAPGAVGPASLMAREVLTTHHLTLDAADSAETIERLRTALSSYTAEPEGPISAALYCTRNSSDVLLVGRWRDVADVTRSLESIYARPELRSGVQSAEFKVYTLVDEVHGKASTRSDR
jgi:hypothetical protein